MKVEVQKQQKAILSHESWLPFCGKCYNCELFYEKSVEYCEIDM